MSDNARRILILRHWLEHMEELPASPWRDREIFMTAPKLREAAAYVIGWGC